MKILKESDKITEMTNRLIDSDTHLLINSVPYLKENNSPIPFNYVPIDSYYKDFVYKNTIGKKGLKSFLNDYVTSQKNDVQYMRLLKTQCQNYIIDNQNPNIIYYFVDSLTGDVTNYRSSKITSSTSEIATSEYSYVYQCKINEDNTFEIVNKLLLTGGSLCSYMTQDADNIYLITYSYQVSYGSSSSSSEYYEHATAMMQPKIVQIKKDLSTFKKTFITPNQYISGYKGSSSYVSPSVCICYPVVLYEVPNEGLVLYTKGFTYGYKENYIINFLFYSFTENKISYLNLPETKFFGLDNKSYILTPNPSSTIAYCPYIIPSPYLEKEDLLYEYLLEPVDNSQSTTYKLYYLTSSKSDISTYNLQEVSLVFPEGSEITELPQENKFAGDSTNFHYNYAESNMDSLVSHIYGYYYETFTSTVDNKNFVHVMYKGDVDNPHNKRGIYTFEINEDNTTATFVSFYSTLGGSFRDYLILSDDRKQILVTTATSYHILNFDAISKKWVSSFDSLKTITTCFITNDNKLYACLSDESIICQDLKGVANIDFNFEKTNYSYNNEDISTYINIWSTNLNDEYIETNLRLTLIGDCVWTSNGLKTLDIKTSTNGPLHVPFTIKGQTTISVSVDSII